MKRLLLIGTAAATTMLCACVDVDLARSAKGVDGHRVTLISAETKSAPAGASENAGNQSGQAAQSDAAQHDDVRLRD